MLKTAMDAWYDEIIAETNNNRSFPAFIGTGHENPVILNRNDAKGTPVAWTQGNALNYWDVRTLEDGVYDITCHFIEPVHEPGTAILKLYPLHVTEEVPDPAGLGRWTFREVKINRGDYRLEPYYLARGREIIFPLYVSVKRVDQ